MCVIPRRKDQAMLFQNEFLHYTLLYTGDDTHRHTFRVELRMKDPVDGAVLTEAARSAIRRYPYYAIEVVPRDRELDIVFNDRPLTVTEGDTTPCLCTQAANRHALAIAFTGSRIFLDVHHGLTDGTGMERFAKTLIYYYVTQKYAVRIPTEGIFTLETPISAEEYGDPFAHTPAPPPKPLSVYPAEAAFDLGAFNPSGERKSVFYLKVRESDLMHLARSNDGTPNALFSALLYRAIIKHHPQPDRPVVGGVAVTMRNAYRVPQSGAGLVGITHIKYTDKVRAYPLDLLGTIGRGAILLQADEQNLLAGVAPKLQLVGYLKTIPDHLRRRMTYMHLIGQTTALDTYSVSYVGKKDWSCFDAYVDAYYTMAEPGTGGLLLEVNTHNGWFNVCITQDFGSRRYVDTLMELLAENAVEFRPEGTAALHLPRQKVF